MGPSNELAGFRVIVPGVGPSNELVKEDELGYIPAINCTVMISFAFLPSGHFILCFSGKSAEVQLGAKTITLTGRRFS